jgi:Fe-Mn family superoxide dismutase
MKHQLPPLPYANNALEPHIDARTMETHHDKHHATYVNKLNEALEKLPQLQDRSATWLLLNLDKVPEAQRTAVANNGGGHVNHCLYWRAMSPSGGDQPKGALADAIDADFGGFDKFKTAFNEAGAKVFGSGWVWLVRAQGDGGKLKVMTTAGHENPMQQGHFPILLNDVWEHAYYLKFQNRRPEFLDGWWSVTNWQEAASRFERSDHSAEKEWEEEGGKVLPEASQKAA